MNVAKHCWATSLWINTLLVYSAIETNKQNTCLCYKVQSLCILHLLLPGLAFFSSSRKKNKKHYSVAVAVPIVWFLSPVLPVLMDVWKKTLQILMRLSFGLSRGLLPSLILGWGYVGIHFCNMLQPLSSSAAGCCYRVYKLARYNTSEFVTSSCYPIFIILGIRWKGKFFFFRFSFFLVSIAYVSDPFREC